MRHFFTLLLLAVAISYGQTTPDCQFTVSFSSASPQSPAFNNKPTSNGGATPCTSWVVTYWTNGASGVSLALQGAPDSSGSPGSYTALTAISSSANPATGTAEGNVLACCDYYPWIRINPTTFTGTSQTMIVRVYGYRVNNVARGSGGGGSGITQLTGDVLAGPGTGSVAATVVGLNTVPFCSGFAPTNGQMIQYTTGGSPNPCYTAAAGAGSGNVTGTGLTAGHLVQGAGSSAIATSGVTVDGSNNVATPGTVSSGDGTATGAVDLTGKTSGSTVTVTVGDSTATGTMTIPGATGTVAYVPSAQTVGDCAQFGSDGISLVSATAPCGTSSGGAVVRLGFVRLSSPAASVTFSSISSAYTNLRLIGQARCSAGVTDDSLRAQFNGDSGANYFRQYMLGENTVLQAGQSVSETSTVIAGITCASSDANYAVGFTIEFPNYSATTFYKNTVATTGYVSGSVSGNMRTLLDVGFWASTAAISSMVLTTNGNFVTGSTFALYGEQ